MMLLEQYRTDRKKKENTTPINKKTALQIRDNAWKSFYSNKNVNSDDFYSLAEQLDKLIDGLVKNE